MKFRESRGPARGNQSLIHRAWIVLPLGLFIGCRPDPPDPVPRPPLVVGPNQLIERVARAEGAYPLTLVLVFDPECGPCGLNMGNWIDLIQAEAASRASSGRERQVAIIGIGVGDPDSVDAYWGVLGKHVPLAIRPRRDSSLFRSVRGTPSTIVLRDGRRARLLTGVLRASERGELQRMIRAAYQEQEVR